MTGYWNEKFILPGSRFEDHYALGNVLVTSSFLVIFLVSWWKQGLLKPEYDCKIVRKGAFQNLDIAIGYLVLYYTSSVIDLFLTETRTTVRGFYELVWVVILAFKITSELYFLLVCHRMLCSLLKNPRSGNRVWLWFLIGELYMVPLIAVALYYVGGYAARIIVSLNDASDLVYDKLRPSENHLQCAFYSLEFVLSAALFIAAGYHLSAQSEEPEFVPKSSYSASSAALWFFARTLSEFIIIIRYYTLDKNTPAYLTLARNIVYGFCTLFMLCSFHYASKRLELKDEINRLLTEGKHRTRSKIYNYVEELKEEGITPRPFEDFISEMLERPDETKAEHAAKKLRRAPEADVTAFTEAHKRYMRVLRDRYVPA